MRNRLRRTHDDSHVAPPSARPTGDTTGVPMEMSDRRSLSALAMLAIDEPEDDGALAGTFDGGVCAFLPDACTETWKVSRSLRASS